ncbi:fumarylacetoacetate hydrolase family protein [Sphingomonas lycopersici]|uniref:Fumarylacetoacetate hydrolase family protein n=1 Tax=Sphingomonas lycopersici TaxID=2951807 RepID=A0AA41Z7C0_9SPHN|nr:fumarylacetoacetate hydrolase family protein [Sphingomonas lycopersici]MCW6535335.1 fumarylacetoacetate hydrolase family protein [Sphingomonas lycopersici]
MISGTAYGVALNDREQLAGLGEALNHAPYGKPPVAPILYVKPRNCFAAAGSAVALPDDIAEVAVGATIAIERTAAGPHLARLAIDLFAPHASFYRPAIAERCRDGFLPVGPATAVPDALSTIEIVTAINGAERHRWSFARLVRSPEVLARDIADFMTLAPGDILLCGIAGDAPVARAGDRIEIAATGFAPLSVTLVAEQAR